MINIGGAAVPPCAELAGDGPDWEALLDALDAIAALAGDDPGPAARCGGRCRHD